MIIYPIQKYEEEREKERIETAILIRKFDSLDLFTKINIIIASGIIMDKLKEMETMEGLCMRCKQKREIANSKEQIMANGRRALSGTCVVCNSKIFKFLPRK